MIFDVKYKVFTNTIGSEWCKARFCSKCNGGKCKLSKKIKKIKRKKKNLKEKKVVVEMGRERKEGSQLMAYIPPNITPLMFPDMV